MHEMDTITSSTLLEGIRDPANGTAWKRFHDRYRPVVICFARKLGLSDTDAQDVAQDTMLAFIEAYRDGRYDPDNGRLRSFLFGIAHHKVIDAQRKRQREVVVADQTDASAFLLRIQDPHSATEVWEKEWRHRVLLACLREVRKEVKKENYRAFVLYALRGIEPAEVARELGIDEDAVYTAKHRITKMICKIRPEIENIW